MFFLGVRLFEAFCVYQKHLCRLLARRLIVAVVSVKVRCTDRALVLRSGHPILWMLSICHLVSSSYLAPPQRLLVGTVTLPQYES